MNLPKNYVDKMQQLLKEEYPAYFQSLDKEVKCGIRVNTRKISSEDFEKIAPYPIRRIPWIENGYYCQETDAWSKHPYYYAGLYYLQEPSAMTPASRLDVRPGDYVLDLCAAPGGKATELAAKLQGEGMLLANDISNSRAKALLKNLELMGMDNIYVTSENPEKLEKHFPEFFDKILVDAPCSGEGMFHKENTMMKFYEEHGPQYYSPIQRKLLIQASHMLKPGGKMIFSTCTFDALEDEGSVHFILEEEPDLHLVEMNGYEGFATGIPYENMESEKCIRIWPHRMEGEGHFLALFEKEEAQKPSRNEVKGISYEQLPNCVKDFLAHIGGDRTNHRFKIQNDRVYQLPRTCEVHEKLRYLRTGLYLGDLKNQRFEPSQAFAMSLHAGEFDAAISLSCEDIRVVKYLKGETISLEDTEYTKEGYQLFCVEGYPLGWGKLQRNMLKNKYYPGWRML